MLNPTKKNEEIKPQKVWFRIVVYGIIYWLCGRVKK